MTVHFDAVREADKLEHALPAFSKPVRKSLYSRFGKRAFDLALIVIALPIIVPTIAVITVLLLLDHQNPFFVQKRVGRDGREFKILKFRTMVENADDRLQEHLSDNPGALVEWRDHQKLKNDPRVTLIGRALRKTSLDEIPQLWNVVRGEMSLVGPRPMMPDQRHLYPGVAYYALCPGITGPWQVSERNSSAFSARATYDTIYGQEISLWADLRILFQTVGVVLRGTGY